MTLVSGGYSPRLVVLSLSFLLLLFLCAFRRVDGKDAESPDDNSGNIHEAKSSKGKPKKIFNFAAQTAGAVLLDNAPQSAKGLKNILSDDKDKYGISPCAEKKWLVIGLSEDILVTSVVVANYEKYSSMLREFRILASTSYPTEEWIDLGTYEAEPKLGEQSFTIPKKESSPHSRYLQFQFLTHYGGEELCTLSQIKVHGTTVIAAFQQEVKDSEDFVKNMLTQFDEMNYSNILAGDETAPGGDAAKGSSNGREESFISAGGVDGQGGDISVASSLSPDALASGAAGDHCGIIDGAPGSRHLGHCNVHIEKKMVAGEGSVEVLEALAEIAKSTSAPTTSGGASDGSPLMVSLQVNTTMPKFAIDSKEGEDVAKKSLNNFGNVVSDISESDHSSASSVQLPDTASVPLTEIDAVAELSTQEIQPLDTPEPHMGLPAAAKEFIVEVMMDSNSSRALASKQHITSTAENVPKEPQLTDLKALKAPLEAHDRTTPGSDIYAEQQKVFGKSETDTLNASSMNKEMASPSSSSTSDGVDNERFTREADRAPAVLNEEGHTEASQNEIVSTISSGGVTMNNRGSNDIAPQATDPSDAETTTLRSEERNDRPEASAEASNRAKDNETAIPNVNATIASLDAAGTVDSSKSSDAEVDVDGSPQQDTINSSISQSDTGSDAANFTANLSSTLAENCSTAIPAANDSTGTDIPACASVSTKVPPSSVFSAPTAVPSDSTIVDPHVSHTQVGNGTGGAPDIPANMTTASTPISANANANVASAGEGPSVVGVATEPASGTIVSGAATAGALSGTTHSNVMTGMGVGANIQTNAQIGLNFGLSSGKATNIQNATFACLELLRFADYKAKMEAKLSAATGLNEQDSKVLPNSQENVFRNLMQKIKTLEMNYHIIDKFTMQSSECTRAALTEVLSVSANTAAAWKLQERMMETELQSQREHIRHLEEIFALFAPLAGKNDGESGHRSENGADGEKEARANRFAYVRDQLAKRGEVNIRVKGYTEDDLLILIATALVFSCASLIIAAIACCIPSSRSRSHMGYVATPRKKYNNEGNRGMSSHSNAVSQNGNISGLKGNENSTYMNNRC